jgi:hypothetical protein
MNQNATSRKATLRRCASVNLEAVSARASGQSWEMSHSSRIYARRGYPHWGSGVWLSLGLLRQKRPEASTDFSRDGTSGIGNGTRAVSCML